MRILYSGLWYALMPALFLRLWWRGRRAPAYRARWRERLALGLPRQPGHTVWVHAVSVGETLAAAPMIRELLARHPATPLVVTTTTPTGSEQVQKLFGDQVLHVYCPWDTPDALARFFRAFNPALVLILETELWPNLVAAAAARHVPVWLVNGRLSERSFRGYHRFRALVRPMMQRFAGLMVQTEAEAERLQRLGAPAERIDVTGSVKFDLQLDDDIRAGAQALRSQWGARPIWIAASTHPGEEAQVLAAHRQICAELPETLLILVPRHPERFDEIARQVTQAGFTLARRSSGQPVAADVQVYLGDTMGELLMLFGTCDVAFVGGSLVTLGGHNLLEPAAWGKPVLSGPNRFNFERIAELLEGNNALITVDDASALAVAVSALLADAERCSRTGEAAQAVVAAHSGALARVLATLDQVWPQRPAGREN
ncbi:lipid IV(A) 3-deoxy-D-manno-octulosonic acid transferase [Alcanivorax quisquiliarum]|uniref:3-deoxy-D-manno-octulosonic acid transferase n=1 Tax=Alcanivorax quisquiliarum TaxID=2933565 RepID=A0ABT0EAQ5_9GAMM|nr:lipid IV(A) 3-deoxy-D-manno-octulosonic acid transferase [Alcanivorax quisquiliarum]MCK0538692.1 lipid IV(A) 3-deoxy-D-manno-octulosonic acid transferase [Alcanivorax quisquiliarum]